MRFIQPVLILIIIILISGAISASDIGKAIVYDIPESEEIKIFDKRPGSDLSPQEIIEIMADNFTGDTMKVLVIPVEWSTRPASNTRETMDSLIFSRNVFSGGSVADYFHEVSYGQVAVVGQVLDWYDAGVYVVRDWDGMGYEDVLYAVDPFVDFSQFDGDNDNVVDAVIFVRAGTGQEDTGDEDDVWSFAVFYPSGYGAGPFDGLLVRAWNTSPEMFPLRDESNPTVFSGMKELNSIGVFCHELGHNFGLDDLYDYDDKLVIETFNTPNDNNDHPLYDWCLMGYGGYGLLSIRKIPPTHFCGFNKMQLEWVEPIPLMGTFSEVVIYPITTTNINSLFMLPIRPLEGEYFLLEYRNNHPDNMFDLVDSDFSCYFWPSLLFGNDPLDEGLLITHIHEAVAEGNSRINLGTPDFPNYTVAVEDAGYNPTMDYTNNPGGVVSDTAQWWYPYESRKGACFSNDVAGQDEFSPTTTPSSDGYAGPTGIVVRVLYMDDDSLVAYVHNPYYDSDLDGIQDGSDNCPNVYNPNQEDSDTDNYGDSCDNCPNVNSSNMDDADTDGVGDVCDACPGYDDNLDADTDGVPDDCDICPGYNDLADGDSDTVPDSCDNCPVTPNTDQTDSDTNNVGDACDYICGDANGDGNVNLGDAVHLINYIFKGGTAPEPLPAGDANDDGDVNLGDTVYLINYIFKGGPAPVCFW